MTRQTFVLIRQVLVEREQFAKDSVIIAKKHLAEATERLAADLDYEAKAIAMLKEFDEDPE